MLLVSFFFLEAIGSNTCSLLNCKDYWKRPDNDVSRALFLNGRIQPHFCFCLHRRVWLLHFIQSMLKNFLVGKNSYYGPILPEVSDNEKLVSKQNNYMVNFCLSSIGHLQFTTFDAGHIFLFHTLIGPLYYLITLIGQIRYIQ